MKNRVVKVLIILTLVSIVYFSLRALLGTQEAIFLGIIAIITNQLTEMD